MSAKDGLDPRLRVDDAGVARIVFDSPGGTASLLDSEALRRLGELLAEVEAGAANGAVRALVVASGRPGSFIAGTDLDELRAVRSADEATERALAGQRVLRALEHLHIPTMAAIDGACLGVGTELALACAYRLASDGKHTRIGLREIRFGIIPGLGATVRLPRLIGPQAALSLVLSGAPVDAARAAELGLVDEVFPVRHFEARVHRFALERVERGRARTGARRGVARRLLEDTAPGRRLVFARAGRRGSTTAADSSVARRAVEAVAEGVALPLEHAFERAAEIHGEMVVSERARGLLHTFLLERRAALAGGPVEHPAERAAVLGAGATGCSVAYLLLAAGIPVRLRDRRHLAAVQGAEQVLAWFEEEARAHATSARERETRAERLVAGTGFGGFGTADVAVVSVGNDPGAIHEAVREAEEHTRDTCIVAVMGDEIPLAALAEESQRPELLVGLRLAQPVDRLTLLEIVPGPRTAAATLAAAHELGRRLGRVPLVVGTAGEGLLDRLLAVYFSEALRMLEEGATVAEVDDPAEAFGWLAGPLKRIDAFGATRAARLLQRFAGLPGGRVRRSALLDRMVEAQRTAAVSFYQYRGGRLVGAGEARKKQREPSMPAEVVQDRLLFLTLAEAAQLLDERAGDTDQVDLVAVAGLGFPRWRGGLLHHAARLDGPPVVERMEALAERHGPRFEPVTRLRALTGAAAATPADSTGHQRPSLLS